MPGNVVSITKPESRAGRPRPVLAVVTEGHPERLALSIWCLEHFTDLSRFRRIYFLSEAGAAPTAPHVSSFVARHRNAVALDCPPGNVNKGLADILRRLADDILVRLSEDTFVTPLWLDGLLQAWQDHRLRPSTPVIAPLAPVSGSGRRCLTGFLARQYPFFWRQVSTAPVDQNPDYHRFIWDYITEDGLLEAYDGFPRRPYHYLGEIDTGCFLFDRRLAGLLDLAPGGNDQAAVNAALRRHGLKAAVTTSTIIHRYASPSCAEALSATLPPAQIRNFFQGLPPERRLRLVQEEKAV